jgi:type II secretion system protein I
MKGGFTLLEMMVATFIMAVAIVGLLAATSSSMQNAARLTDYDRAAMVARTKMDALLLDYRLPRDEIVEGLFDPAMMGGARGGWRARLTIYELPPQPQPEWNYLERLELQVWWMSGPERRSFSLEGFRRNVLTGADIPQVVPPGQ